MLLGTMLHHMVCPSKKRSYLSKEEAEEALVQHHIQFYHKEGQGPLDVYECEYCGSWHFTSKGPISGVLTSDTVKRRIQKERIAMDWERKLK